MVSCQWRFTQVIKVRLALATSIALPRSLLGMEPAFLDFVRSAVRTHHPLWPSHRSDLFIAFGIVYDFLYL